MRLEPLRRGGSGLSPDRRRRPSTRSSLKSMAAAKVYSIAVPMRGGIVIDAEDDDDVVINVTGGTTF